MEAPGIALMIDGGGYITLISKIIAHVQNIKNPKWYPKNIIFNILSSVL